MPRTDMFEMIKGLLNTSLSDITIGKIRYCRKYTQEKVKKPHISIAFHLSERKNTHYRQK